MHKATRKAIYIPQNVKYKQNLITNLDSILKSKDITFPTKFYLVKAMVFPVVMYGCESWTMKKAEHWKTDALELSKVVLEKTLESPLDCKDIKPVYPKGNQSRIFIGRTDAEAETPILWPWRTDSLEKTPDAGKDWRQEEKGMTVGKMVGWPTQWTWDWVHSGSWWWIGRPGMLQSMGNSKSQTRLSDWTELNWMNYSILLIWIPR